MACRRGTGIAMTKCGSHLVDPSLYLSPSHSTMATSGPHTYPTFLLPCRMKRTLYTAELCYPESLT